MFYLLHSAAIVLLMLGSYSLGFKQATQKVKLKNKQSWAKDTESSQIAVQGLAMTGTEETLKNFHAMSAGQQKLCIGVMN